MVENHLSEDLYLFFPQWEGSGETNVYTGATILRQILNHAFLHRRSRVEVSNALRVEHDIIGYPHILSHAHKLSPLEQQRSPRRYFFPLGGDCGLMLSDLLSHTRYDGDLAVIWLDAHADANTPQSLPIFDLSTGWSANLVRGGRPRIACLIIFDAFFPTKCFSLGQRYRSP